MLDCRWDASTINLDEGYRFANAGMQFGAHLHWDVLRIRQVTRDSPRKFWNRAGSDPSRVSIDAWGVDFDFLGGWDRPIGNPYHYRDARAKGNPQEP